MGKSCKENTIISEEDRIFKENPKGIGKGPLGRFQLRWVDCVKKDLSDKLNYGLA